MNVRLWLHLGVNMIDGSLLLRWFPLSMLRLQLLRGLLVYRLLSGLLASRLLID